VWPAGEPDRNGVRLEAMQSQSTVPKLVAEPTVYCRAVVDQDEGVPAAQVKDWEGLAPDEAVGL